MCRAQLYLNYKLKSVAHLPWRQMTYKFLNTIIDDLFAFVIKMPLLHRLSVFRDDLVFLVYIYQRWIYRVDPKRANEFGRALCPMPSFQWQLLMCCHVFCAQGTAKFSRHSRAKNAAEPGLMMLGICTGMRQRQMRRCRPMHRQRRCQLQRLLPRRRATAQPVSQRGLRPRRARPRRRATRTTSRTSAARCGAAWVSLPSCDL